MRHISGNSTLTSDFRNFMQDVMRCIGELLFCHTQVFWKLAQMADVFRTHSNIGDGAFDWKSLTVYARSFSLGVWLGSEYTFDLNCRNKSTRSNKWNQINATPGKCSNMLERHQLISVTQVSREITAYLQHIYFHLVWNPFYIYRLDWWKCSYSTKQNL